MAARFRRALSLGLACAILLPLAQLAPVEAKEGASQDGLKALSLEAIFSQDRFRPQLPRQLRWQADSRAFTYLPAAGSDLPAGLYRQSLDGSTPQRLLDFARIPGLPEDFTVTDVQWHAAQQVALLRGPVTVTWHGYEDARWFVHDLATGRTRPLADTALRHVKLSPDGRRAGYVHDNNLHVVELDSGEVTPVTSDGSDSVFNGSFDYGSTMFGWVDAWRWAPDSSALAFWRLDASDVKTYPLVDPLHSYPEVRRFHYPNAGERHAVYRIGVHALDEGRTRWLETGHDADDYLPQMTWAPDSKGLFVQRLARDHQTLELLYADAAGGSVQSVLVDRDPAWLDITDDLTPLAGDEADGDILWSSERSGWRHLYRVSRQGTIQALTGGDWSVDALIGVDEARGWVYFYAKKDSLIDQQVYRVPLSGGPVQRVTQEPGWHTWTLSPDGRFAIAQHSDARTPPTLSLRAADGPIERVLVEDVSPALRDYAMPHTEFIRFTTDDGVTLNGFFIKPLDFDPDKRYPVIGYGYGNAGSQVVVNRWGTQRGPQQDLWHRYMAQQGYVIFAMDNRTTRGRGKAAKNLTYGHYAKYAVRDQLQGARYLKSLPWVDDERLGFWGWSGGGYLAAALMTKGAPHWKVAVSVAPVIDLTRYQAVGVERWMGMPAENPEGYAAVNLMNDADKLQGRLLLIHGTGDDNVKFDFTLQFVDALIRADRQFDMLAYPNQRHAISDFRGHVFASMTRYFLDHL
jgi:dipeptidyl-peptidase-4